MSLFIRSQLKIHPNDLKCKFYRKTYLCTHLSNPYLWRKFRIYIQIVSETLWDEYCQVFVIIPSHTEAVRIVTALQRRSNRDKCFNSDFTNRYLAQWHSACKHRLDNVILSMQGYFQCHKDLASVHYSIWEDMCALFLKREKVNCRQTFSVEND